MNTFEQDFEDILKGKEPTTLYDPISYILLQPGKRLRPQLVHMSVEMFGGSAEDARKIALAFEMLHNFTLIHDDIMDEAPIRRGKETVYKKWNSNIAILSGDAMLAKAPVAFPLTNSWYLASFYVANGCTLFGADGTNNAAGIDG